MKYVCLFLSLLLCAAAFPGAAPAEEAPGAGKLVEELCVYYGTYGPESEQALAGLLDDLRLQNPDTAGRWERILSLWTSVNTDLTVNEGVLPDGLPDTDELCLVALGFQLNPDGTMKDELVERLKVVLASAEKYPRAYVVCTGGGTASENSDVTEAGAMAAWLTENGLDPQRVIVEDKSLTTAQNAMFTYQILTEQYPQVSQLAIISSDYHIATGALIELSGDVETAFAIYYDTYDIHELPPLGD